MDNASDTMAVKAAGAAPLPAPVDLQTARDLAPYFNASKRLAAPNRRKRAQRKVLARVRTGGERYDEWKLAASEWFAQADLAPDLAQDIGSRRWFRGLGTMFALGAVAFALWPDLAMLEARAAMPRDDAVRAQFHNQAIAPLALGAGTGRRVAPTDAVIPLAKAPERPRIELAATFAPGDNFASTMRRAGVSGGDIERAGVLIGGAMPLTAIEPGTRFDIVLGRRPAPNEARPLDALVFRARFDLELALRQQGPGGLVLVRKPIRVDDTPLRLRGTVGSSLYRSMRAAGVPAGAVQEYVRALGDQLDLDREVRSGDQFDIILEYRRAATGDRQAGKLLYAGIDRGGQPATQLVRWGSDGKFYEASGVGEQRSGLLAPVPGRIGSGYGMRRHPILGYRRMHSGLDFRARHGTPIVAVTDGRVRSAGRAGGCGIAVRLTHDGALGTRYCHMSRLAVRSGQQVRRGQVIGYVGSTGLSTGPHLHYEMTRNGRKIDPASVQYVTRAVLSGTELIDFRRRLLALKQVEPGAALADLAPRSNEQTPPEREIEKIDLTRRID